MSSDLGSHIEDVSGFFVSSMPLHQYYLDVISTTTFELTPSIMESSVNNPSQAQCPLICAEKAELEFLNLCRLFVGNTFEAKCIRDDVMCSYRVMKLFLEINCLQLTIPLKPAPFELDISVADRLQIISKMCMMYTCFMSCHHTRTLTL